MNTNQTMSALESLLFISSEPLPVERLVQVLNLSEEAVLRGLEDLVERYESLESGLSLVRTETHIQLVTKPSNAPYLEAFSKSTLQESLSKAALEVLAVIAYRGPMTRSEIEAIRGVNCSVTLRNLLMRELIERKENDDDARGYMYNISPQFLKELGLQSETDLPDYESLIHDDRLLSVIESKPTA